MSFIIIAIVAYVVALVAAARRKAPSMLLAWCTAVVASVWLMPVMQYTVVSVAVEVSLLAMLFVLGYVWTRGWEHAPEEDSGTK